MKILITGGAGFLGSNLAADALKEGHEVIVFDNLSRTGSASNLEWLLSQGSPYFINGDIRSRDDVSTLIESVKPDAIYHLAGQVAMTTSIARPRYDFEVNTVGTFNLLESVRQYSSSSLLVYSSTNKVYGDLAQYSYNESPFRYTCNEYPFGFNEEIPLSFHSPYGCTKGAADQLVIDYHRIFGLKTIVFRHSSMYGLHQHASLDQGWIGWFCKQAINTVMDSQHIFTISGNGKQVRDLLHADDMKTLYRAALTSVPSAHGQAYNIGGSHVNSLSLLELFTILEAKLDITLNYDSIPPRISDQLVFISDTTKASRLFNWLPSVSSDYGLTQYLDWLTSCIP